MVDIVVQRGEADRPGTDIVEPLLATVPAAVARGAAELDSGEPADKISLMGAARDVRLGHSDTLSDPVAGRWAGKVTGVTHSFSIDDEGNMMMDTQLEVEVPRASRA